MRSILQLVVLSLFAVACATTEVTRPSTVGDDPADLQALLFGGPYDGKGFCLVTPAVPEGLTRYCIAKSGEVHIKYVSDPSTGEETIRFTYKDVSIVYDDSTDKSRLDGKFKIEIDEVVIIEGAIKRERAATVADQLLFNNWRAWLEDRDNVKTVDANDIE